MEYKRILKEGVDHRTTERSRSRVNVSNRRQPRHGVREKTLKIGGVCILAVAALFGVTASQVGAQSASLQISVDAAAKRHAINPNIYGVAYGTQAQLADLNTPLNRRGGNNTTRYNWQANAENKASDWYFESLPFSSSTPGDEVDQFVSTSKGGNAQPAITIPTIGWVAKLGSGRSRLSSFSIAKYGAQQDSDWQWYPDAGNGVHTNGANITGNDPNDASVLTDSTFQQGWVNHLISRWGSAQNGGVRYYILDNEPSLWHGTHRDVHPTGAKMDEIRDKLLDYGAKVKAADPNSVVLGPEEWGWSGYFYSGYDQQWGDAHGWSSLPDRTAHNNWDYLPYLLDQLRQNQASTGQRLLDVFTVHYYPQSGEFSDDTSTATQLLRNQSTRSMWDPNYVDQSWINDKVQLIPRLRNWVNTYYPGTQIGITEYNWGAEGHINGATTQADLYGIFGREGLDLATRWTTPDATTPTYLAMKLYRNYDGKKSTFGDVSVSATVPNPDNVSAFAAQRTSDGALTVMVINKQLSSSAPLSISLANFSAAGPAQAWQLTSSNAINQLAGVPVSGGVISTTVPAQSITLFVVPGTNSTTGSTVSALGVNPTSVTGGSTSTGTVTLSGAAPSGGASVALSSSSSAATVPASVTVAAGATSATFTVNTTSVSGSATATITASYGGTSKSAALTVQPATATASISAVSVNPTTVTGGSTSTGTVTLSGAAPSGGASVALSSSSSAATVPASVTVAAGATSATFTVNTTSVSGSATATITASYGGTSKSAALTVQPATSATPTFNASASASPNPVNSGASTAVTSKVTCTAGSLTNGIIDVEIYNSAGAQVKQVYYTGQNFATGQTISNSFSWTPSTAGSYTMKIGVFTQNWATGLYWSDNAGTITVQTAASAAPTFSSWTYATPNPVTHGSSVSLTANVTCTAGSLTNGIIDVEIYNSAGAQVKQVYYTGQNFATGQTISNSFSWTPSTAGSYTMKIGVFTQNWATGLYWSDNAGTITVN